VSVPVGGRRAEVAQSRDSGAFRVVSLLDREGPEPQAGQFYELALEDERGAEDGGGLPPRAIAVAGTRPAAGGVRLDFLLDGAGPATRPLADARVGEGVWVTGPLGVPFAAPRKVFEGAAGAVLVGGGVGAAPLALLRRRFAEAAVPHRVLLGFDDRAHTGGLDLFCGSSGALCPEVRVATEDGHLGVQGRVTDLLMAILAGDDAPSGVVYGCGPPAMLETVRALCAGRSVAAELRGESGVHTPL
jgi:NAD(P)H-flavin reductase